MLKCKLFSLTLSNCTWFNLNQQTFAQAGTQSDMEDVKILKAKFSSSLLIGWVIDKWKIRRVTK